MLKIIFSSKDKSVWVSLHFTYSLIALSKLDFKFLNPACPTFVPATKQPTSDATLSDTDGYRDLTAITVAVKVSPAPRVSTTFGGCSATLWKNLPFSNMLSLSMFWLLTSLLSMFPQSNPATPWSPHVQSRLAPKKSLKWTFNL